MTWLTCCLSVNPRLMVALVCINNIWLTHWNLGFHSLFRVYKSDTQMKLELPVFERYAILKNKKRERENGYSRDKNINHNKTKCLVT